DFGRAGQAVWRHTAAAVQRSCPCEVRAPTWDERCDARGTRARSTARRLQEARAGRAARARRQGARAARSWLPPRDAAPARGRRAPGRHARQGRACGARPARPAVSAAWVALVSITALLQRMTPPNPHLGTGSRITTHLHAPRPPLPGTSPHSRTPGPPAWPYLPI